MRAAEPASKSDSAEISERQQRLVALIRQWMEADDDYDDRVWPILEEELKKDRFRLRDNDESAA